VFFLAYVGGGGGASGVQFGIKYPDSKGLKQGQYLKFKGQKIGIVDRIDLNADHVIVHVSVEEEHISKIGADFDYKIKSVTLLSAEKYIEVEKGYFKQHIPIKEGQIINGTINLADQIEEGIEEWTNSPEARELKQEIGEGWDNLKSDTKRLISPGE
jgi:ABC-type transporter Mla subunit MlaD